MPTTVSDTQLIIEPKDGDVFRFSYNERPLTCQAFNHVWRVIACDDEHDVRECHKCGVQGVSRCSFDDDMA